MIPDQTAANACVDIVCNFQIWLPKQNCIRESAQMVAVRVKRHSAAA